MATHCNAFWIFYSLGPPTNLLSPPFLFSVFVNISWLSQEKAKSIEESLGYGWSDYYKNHSSLDAYNVIWSLLPLVLSSLPSPPCHFCQARARCRRNIWSWFKMHFDRKTFSVISVQLPLRNVAKFLSGDCQLRLSGFLTAYTLFLPPHQTLTPTAWTNGRLLVRPSPD